MKKILKCLPLLGLMACAHPQHIVYNQGDPRLQLRSQHILFHADTEYTVDERALIDESMIDIFKQTSGLLRPEIRYDADFSSTAVIVGLVKQYTIGKLTSAASIIPMNEDSRHPLLGYNDVDLRDTDLEHASHLFLVVDRAPTKALFKRAIMHEVLHSYRIKHNAWQGAIMNPSMTLNEKNICLTKGDAESICEVYHCVPEQLSYCEEK